MPKVKTVQEHITEGTFRGDRHTATALQPYVEQLPQPSEMLNDFAKELFYIEVGFLNKNRMYNPAWQWQIEMMCHSIALAFECMHDLKGKTVDELVNKDKGLDYMDGKLRLMWKSYGEAHKIAMQLGITPVAFTKFKQMTDESKPTDLQKLLQRKKKI